MIRRYYYDGVKSTGLSGEELDKLLEECIKADEELTEWPPIEEEYKLLEW